MPKVFVAGSRNITRLNAGICAKLDEMARRRATFLIGDANGADKAVQAHLASAGYSDVIVYHVGRCRNNLGSWPVRVIETAGGESGFAFYAAKDAAMAKDADCGFMLWDEKSKGTFNNIETLARLGKKTLVYVSPRKAFYTLSSKKDLDEFLRLFSAPMIAELREQIRGRLAGTAQGKLIPAG